MPDFVVISQRLNLPLPAGRRVELLGNFWILSAVLKAHQANEIIFIGGIISIMSESNENGKQLHMAFEGESQVDTFQKNEVRKVFHEGEWWFSVKDVLEALVETSDGTRYAADLRKRDEGLNERYSEITRTLKYDSNGGTQKTKFINIEGIFRLMQSVSTKRAEPFKKWLARVGFERVQEIQNPELAVKRAIVLYKVKGYDDRWIEARIQNKISREQLVDEWNKRGVVIPIQYAVLTDAISVETFNIKTSEHKKVKGLKKHHTLRDHMTPIELTLTTLGEQATKEISETSNAKGFHKNLQAAKKGGHIAGTARIQIEQETKKPVVSEQNYLTERQKKTIKELPESVKIIEKTMDELLHTDKD